MVKNKVIPAGSVCHIVQRAPGKELLFLEEGDYFYFLKLLKETSHKHDIDIFCFVLMPNHFHLLCRFNKDNASGAIKNLCERYAWFFNNKYKRKGHVFHGRFRAGLCLDDSYLLAASLYIHVNPVKAKLASSFSLYPWSSCSFYTESQARRTFINYKFILMVVHKNIKEAQTIYKCLLGKSFKIHADNILENPRVLRELRNKLFPAFLNINKTIAKHKSILTDDLLEKKIKELSSQRRLRNPQDRKARRYLVQQLMSRGYDLEDIADKLKCTKRTVKNIIATKS